MAELKPKAEGQAGMNGENVTCTEREQRPSDGRVCPVHGTDRG